MLSVGQGLADGRLKLDAWTENVEGGPWNRGVGGSYDSHGGPPCSHAFSRQLAPPSAEKNAGSPASRTRPLMEDCRDNQEHPSCNSRARAIARCREEMLGMVKDMPEFAYELSLRDLVELPEIVNSMQEADEGGKEDGFRIGDERRKGRKGKKRTDDGFFLRKVFFLHSLGGRRRKSSVTIGPSKVMSKPMPTEGEKGLPEKSGDGEWFEENELSDLRENNGVIGRSRRRRMNGCYSFFQSSKSYIREI